MGTLKCQPRSTKARIGAHSIKIEPPARRNNGGSVIHMALEMLNSKLRIEKRNIFASRLKMDVQEKVLPALISLWSLPFQPFCFLLSLFCSSDALLVFSRKRFESKKLLRLKPNPEKRKPRSSVSRPFFFFSFSQWTSLSTVRPSLSGTPLAGPSFIKMLKVSKTLSPPQPCTDLNAKTERTQKVKQQRKCHIG